MEEERHCENCRFAVIYDGKRILGCLKDGSLVFPLDICDKHLFVMRGRKKRKL